MIDTYPATLAIVAYHLSDGYQTAFGGMRRAFYAGHPLNYVPDMRFDGLFDPQPPDYYPMDYTDYQSEFLARRAIATDTTIELVPRQVDGDDFEVTAHVCVEAGGASKTMRVLLAWVLDTYPGLELFHTNTCRGGVNVGDITVDPGTCQDISTAFTFDSVSWTNRTEIQLIGWVQAPLPTHPAEVYQATKLHWPDLVPGFTYDPQVVFATVPVQFSDQTTGTVDSWEWDFGDGGTSTEQNPIHTFTQLGSIPVTLRVAGSGWSLATTENVEVWDAVPPAPGFSYSPTSPATGQTVYFFDTSTGYATSWAWDFSDGGTSTEQNPTHVFAAGGLYTVTLTATNQWGSDSVSQVVEIGDADTVFSDGFEGTDTTAWSVSVP